MWAPKERLTLQVPSTSKDSHGALTGAFTDYATISGELIPLRASEALQAGAVQAQLDLRFRVRRRTDLAAKMRISWTPSWPAGASAQTLEISGIVPEGDGRAFMFLNCGVLQ